MLQSHPLCVIHVYVREQVPSAQAAELPHHAEGQSDPVGKNVHVEDTASLRSTFGDPA